MKKQQVLLVNGGNTFEDHSDYMKSLRESPISLERMRFKGNWKHRLQKDLGEEYDVLTAPMPNPGNAVFKEWCIVFEKVMELLDEDVIIIGHSLGGVFLANYFGLHKWKKGKLKAVILLAAPHDDETKEPLGDFFAPYNLDDLNKGVRSLYLLHSKDDPVVPFTELEKYQDKLSRAISIEYDDKKHFNDEEFPELVELIESL